MVLHICYKYIFILYTKDVCLWNTGYTKYKHDFSKCFLEEIYSAFDWKTGSIWNMMRKNGEAFRLNGKEEVDGESFKWKVLNISDERQRLLQNSLLWIHYNISGEDSQHISDSCTYSVMTACCKTIIKG